MELLVVIAIIGTLVGLLLPAVQAAREAARRISCFNNLKQMGLALHNYADAKKSLPPGAIWWTNQISNPNFQNNRGNLMMFILPFIEQSSLYDQFKFSACTDLQRVGGVATAPYIGSTPVSFYRCPSDTSPEYNEVTIDLLAPGTMATISYAASKGPTRTGDNPAGPCPEYAVYDAYALSFNDNEPAGPFTRNGRIFVCKMKDIPDGLSKTIAIGETRAACFFPAQRGWSHSSNGQGLVSTVFPLNYDSCTKDKTNGNCRWFESWSSAMAFRSRHPGGSNFVMCDGSVTFLQQDIDHWTYQYLGGRMDAKTVSLP